MSLKVLQADGSGRTSDVLAAIEWLRANHRRYQVRIVNISLGHPVFESYEDDPLAQAVQRLIDEGLVVVASAGTTVPGGVIPPEYLATAPDGSPLIAMSGTSESAGVVAGVAALMLEANPSLRHRHVKMALELSAEFLPEGVLVAGSGSLNAAGAVWMAVNGPSPKVPAAVIGDAEITASGVLFWTGARSGLREIIDGNRIIWGDKWTGFRACVQSSTGSETASFLT